MVNRSWWQGRSATLTWLLTLVAGLLVAAAYPAVAASSGGSKTPSIAVAPHYKVAGKADPAVPPTFSCQTQPSGRCFGPAQIRAAYGIDKVNATGAGRTIVIVDAFQSPTIQHDLDLFDSTFGLPAATVNIIAPDGLTPFDQGNSNMVNWAGEITLDVEWAHAVAPGAAIDLVLAKSNNDADILSAQRYAVENDLGDVISQSFGEAEQCMDPSLLTQTHDVFEQASAAKMTLIASSGDQGASQPTCDGSSWFKAVSTPASDPDVTGIGGTRLDANGLTGVYNGEIAWNEPDFAVASGGGYSVVYKRPGYQKTAVAGHKRGVPDVSYNGA